MARCWTAIFDHADRSGLIESKPEGAIDSTGLEATHRSSHYVWRRGKRYRMRKMAQMYAGVPYRLASDYVGALHPRPYCLIDDTRMQAVFILEGPPRSGKGTILRQLQKVVGVENCVSPRLSSLGEMFGLQALVGKRVAILPDAHLGHGDKAMSVLETIKLVSGEDGCEIHRKHLPSIPHARLRIRFVMAVNELPKFSDYGKTLASRVRIIPFRESFLGREDRNLESKLERELPGVFNWAMSGLRRLWQSETFTKPAVSRQIEQDFARLSSPLQAFIEDYCAVGTDCEIKCADLWTWWEWWCKKNGHLPGSPESLGARLRGLVPNLQRTEARKIWEQQPDGQSLEVRRRFYVGIGIKPRVEMDE